jgi:hypothetical protein
MSTRRSIPLFFLAAAAGLAAGPVYVHTTGSAIALGNDYLERTISTADSDVGTRHFLNKLTGRAYSLRGDEFELKLNYERVGYSFGNENPRVVTAAGMRLASQKTDDTPAGGKRITLHLAPARGAAAASVDLVYELNPADFFTRQWLHIAKPQQGTLVLEWVAPPATNGACRASPSAASASRSSPKTCSSAWNTPPASTRSPATKSLSANWASIFPMAATPASRLSWASRPPAWFTSSFSITWRACAWRPSARTCCTTPGTTYQRLAMNHDNTLERVPTFQKLLLGKYGLHLDSFVLDDGWDDMHKLWVIDQQRFPNGFHDLRRAQDHRQPSRHLVRPYRRLRPARGAHRHRQGRRHGDQLQRPLFLHRRQELQPLLGDTMLKYQKEYGINYFKLDGIAFGCNEPDHGHPQGVYSDEATARTFIDLLEEAARAGPQSVPQYHHQHLAEPLVAALRRYRLDGRRRFRLPAVCAHARGAAERRELSRLGPLRRLRHAQSAVPHLVADDSRHHQGPGQHARRREGRYRRLARRSGPLLQRG